jgi:hypothetical protein
MIAQRNLGLGTRHLRSNILHGVHHEDVRIWNERSLEVVVPYYSDPTRQCPKLCS